LKGRPESTRWHNGVTRETIEGIASKLYWIGGNGKAFLWDMNFSPGTVRT